LFNPTVVENQIRPACMALSKLIISRMKITDLFKRSLTNPTGIEAINLLCASSVYFILIVIPPPPYISQALGQPGWLILMLLIIFFALLLRQKGNAWEGIQNVFIFSLFALPLIYKWQFAQFVDFNLGGLFPWSDASGYLQEAQRLLNGSFLTVWGSRRPLFSAFLAVMLELTGRNFMVSHAVLTLVNALTVLLVVREVRRIYGATGASVLLIFAYEFYIRFAGTTMTEQLGFALGNLAVFFLLIASQDKNLNHALLGLGLISLGLIARAGAFFILPVLIVWMVIPFQSKNVAWRASGLAAIVIAAAFILNSVILKTVGNPRGDPFSNYSYTLYGLASGNKGWFQAKYDHPNDSAREVMQLALQKTRSDPMLLLKGIRGSYLDYFKTDGGAFSFISFGRLQTNATLVLWVLTLTGLVYAALNWKKGNHALILASFVGVFASVAFVPPIDSDGMRVYAATIPFTALWVIEGLFALETWCKKLFRQKEDSSSEEAGSPIQKLAIGFSAVLIVMLFPAPILLRSLARGSFESTLPPAQTACESGQQLLQGSVLRNMSINVIPNEAANESYMPFIRVDDFRRAINSKNPKDYPYMTNELLGLQAGQQISFGFDLNLGIDWLVSDFPVEVRKYSICGYASENQELRQNDFYILKDALVSRPSRTISQQYPSITLLFRLLYGLGASIVIFLMVMTSLDFKTSSPAAYFYTMGIMILILQGIFVSLYTQAIIHLPIADQRLPLHVKDAYPDNGLYILPLGINWMSQADLGLSPAIVYENGVPLALPNSKPKSIKYDGNGRYSVSNGYLYFTSSDNTDPRTNGRKYELAWPHPIHPVLQWIAYLVSLLGVAILFFREWITRTTGSWLTKKFK
jgi:hypothetical protein